MDDFEQDDLSCLDLDEVPNVDHRNKRSEWEEDRNGDGNGEKNDSEKVVEE